MTQFRIRGVIPPIVTPFTPGAESIDGDALQAHADWLIEKGVHGLMPCGTTGEGPLLTAAERKEVLDMVAEAADGRVPLLAHVGGITTRETIDLAVHAAARGADAVSVVTPYYFKLPDRAMVEHFCAVAGAVPETPVFLYNIPQCTGNWVNPAMLREVAGRCPNVIGIKDSAGYITLLQAFIQLAEGSFQVACGSDALVFQAFQAGACACVSGNANAFPEVVVGIFECFWAGDLVGAEIQQQLLNEVREALHNGGSIAMIKRAIEMRGLQAGGVRPPLADVVAGEVEVASERLRAAGLLE